MRNHWMVRIPFGKRTLALKLNMWWEKISTYYGITNETDDGFYVPFFDFVENVTINDLLNTLNFIQYEYGLSDIHIIQTAPKPSFRAVAFDKMEKREFFAMLCDTDFLDWSYFKHSVMRGRAVIRITNKPSTENKIVQSLKRESFLRKKSVDHATFFAWLFGIPLGTWSLKMIEPPKKLNLKLSKYETFR